MDISVDWIGLELEYWTSPLDGAAGDDAVADGYSAAERREAVRLIRNGGPWDEEILGPRPAAAPISWKRSTPPRTGLEGEENGEASV